MKKHLKWIIPALALVIAVVIGFVVFSVNEKKAPNAQQTTMKVYWNVEREDYLDENRNTTRMVSNGYYRIRMAVDGEQDDYFFPSEEMATQADRLCFMGLIVDEENVVSKVVPVEEFTGGTAVLNYFVQELTDTTVKVNLSGAHTGPSITYGLTENTKVYDVTDGGILSGIPGTIKEDCSIWAVLGLDGNLSHVYVADPFQPHPVYWNIERMWNEETGTTSRVADGLEYTILFAVDGQQVELKTREWEIANAVDARAGQSMHLEFDENGYISAVKSPYYATGGNSVAGGYVVTSVTAEGFVAEKKAGTNLGDVVECTFSKNVKVFNMSKNGAYVGEPTDLREGDQVRCLCDPFGRVCIAFVVNRPIESEIYWNIEQQYNADTQSTTRVPAKDGWYYIDFAVCGTQKTLKTQDKAIATAVDAVSTRTMALKLDGDVILGVYRYLDAYGFNGSIGGWCTVVELNGNQVKLLNKNESSANFGMKYSFEIPKGTPIYNVSNNFLSHVGEETTVKMGDKLFTLVDGDKVAYILVVARPVSSPIYWNVDRCYDSDRQTTSRTPAQDGYYYITFAVDGKLKTLKTNSKAIATKVDEFSNRTMGLKVSGDKILDVYKYTDVSGFTGSIGGWCTVTKLNGNQVTLTGTSPSSSHYGKSYTFSVPNGTPIYNVSNTAAVVGEATKIKLGDKLFTLKDGDAVAYVLVVERPVVSDIYWNIDRQYDTTLGTTTRTPAADGFYYIKFAVNGQQKEFKTNNIELVNAIDSVSTNVVGLQVNGNEIQKVYKYTDISGFTGSIGGWCTVTKLNGNQVTLTGKSPSSSHYGKNYTFSVPNGTPIYNVSNTAGVVGEPTQIQLGDKLFTLQNGDTVVYVLVVERPATSKIYWNVKRQYNTSLGITTRTPAEDGYYYIKFAVDGQQIELKTNNIELVNAIDSVSTNVVGLQVNGNEIQKVYKYTDVEGYTGSIGGWFTVTGLDGAKVTITDTRTSSANYGVTYTYTMPEGTPVYNVSTNVEEFVGESAQIRMGDQLFTLKNGETPVLIFVVTRTVAPVEPDVPDDTVTHDDHCVCNGSADGLHTCETVTWEPWTGVWSDGGHYYLTKDIQGLNYTKIEEGQTLTICLNGFDIYGKSTTRIFDIYGTLNICDHKDAEGYLGTITGEQTEASLATVFYLRNGGSFNLYGGNITTENSATQATIGVVAGTMNLYDGKIYGGTATGEGTGMGGGNIGIFAGTLNMYSGEISGGKALSGVGGNVFVNSDKGMFNMYGGIITGGEATQGGGVYSKADICMGSAAQVINNTPTDIELSQGKVVEIIPEETTHTDHCICGGSAENVGDHTCHTVTWEPWTGVWTDGGYYYLTEEVDGLGYTKIEAGQTLTICLNGFDIVGKSNARIFDIYGNLNICDHKVSSVYGGTISGMQSGASLATVFYLRNGGSFNLYGGNITTENSATQATIGVVAGVMNLYDGKISGGIATGEGTGVGGGNIGIFAGTLNMYGGEISGGKALSGVGGNVFVNSDKGMFNMYGGIITGGEAAQGGGVYSKANIRIGENAQIVDNILTDVELSEGKVVEIIPEETTHTDHCICGGSAENVGEHTCQTVTWEPWTGVWTDGGHYYLTEDVDGFDYTKLEAGQTLTICLNGFDIVGKSNARIFDIYGTLNICDHRMEEGYLGNVCGAQSGASLATVFYLRKDGTLNLFGGNMLTQHDAAQATIGVVAGAMNLYDGKIYGGTATGEGTGMGGGNIGIFAGTLNMYGGEISGGKALSGVGGNVFVNSDKGMLNMYGGIITGGEAAQGGGVYSKANIRIGENAQIVDNILTDVELSEGKVVEIIPEETTHTDHCICGGSAENVGDHTCQTVTWEPWTGVWTDGGYYYLTEDVDGLGYTKIEAGQTLTICLNGFDIVGKSNARIFDIYGNLNICDHKVSGVYGGTISGMQSGASLATVFYLRNGGSFNLFGGNITTQNSATQATIGVVAGVMNLYDGKISGGIATGEGTGVGGGNIGIFAGTLNMYGGEISGGKALSGVGGNVFVNSDKGMFNMYGGIITGGEAAQGGGVYSKANITLGAQAKICGNIGSDLTLGTGKLVSISSDLENEQAVGITLTTGKGVFTVAVDEKNIQAFFSNEAWKVICNPNGQLELVEPES